MESNQPECVLATKSATGRLAQDAQNAVFPNNPSGLLSKIDGVKAHDDLFQISHQLMDEARARYWSARHSHHVVVRGLGGLARQEFFSYYATQEKANFEFVWEESKRLHEQMNLPFVVPRLEQSVVDFNWCEYNKVAVSMVELEYQQYLAARRDLDTWLDRATKDPNSPWTVKGQPSFTGNESKLIELYTITQKALKRVHSELKIARRRRRVEEHGKLQDEHYAIVKHFIKAGRAIRK